MLDLILLYNSAKKEGTNVLHLARSSTLRKIFNLVSKLSQCGTILLGTLSAEKYWKYCRYASIIWVDVALNFGTIVNSERLLWLRSKVKNGELRDIEEWEMDQNVRDYLSLNVSDFLTRITYIYLTTFYTKDCSEEKFFNGMMELQRILFIVCARLMLCFPICKAGRRISIIDMTRNKIDRIHSFLD
jgi:hypothetical protein